MLVDVLLLEGWRRVVQGRLLQSGGGSDDVRILFLPILPLCDQPLHLEEETSPGRKKDQMRF